VANYVHDENTRGKPPIVLARLPRVRAAQPVPVSQAVNPPVPPSAPLPEVMPQLDLRAQIDQRTRLHIAATPADGPSHYVDQQHVAPRPEQLSAPKQYQPLQHQPPQHKPTESRTTVAQPTSLGEKLFQLHAQLAPHAGLIVAMALIASAGLLYWMIVGPVHVPLPNFQNPDYKMQPEGFGVTSDYLPEYTAPVETANVEQPSEPVSSSPDEWTSMLLPAPPQVAVPAASLAGTAPIKTTPVETTLVESKSPLRELPPAGELSPDALNFLTTSNPKNLDYSKLVPLSTEMARRPTESTHR